MDFAVDHRPTQTNKPTHTYVVLRNGTPLLWWRREESAQAYADARNDGLPVAEARGLALEA